MASGSWCTPATLHLPHFHSKQSSNLFLISQTLIATYVSYFPSDIEPLLILTNSTESIITNVHYLYSLNSHIVSSEMDPASLNRLLQIAFVLSPVAILTDSFLLQQLWEINRTVYVLQDRTHYVLPTQPTCRTVLTQKDVGIFSRYYWACVFVGKSIDLSIKYTGQMDGLCLKIG